MVLGELVRDPSQDIVASGQRPVGQAWEYELTFPLKNEDLADLAWEQGQPYQIAFLIGPTEEFTGLVADTWMSDQFTVWVGGGSASVFIQPVSLQLAPQASGGTE
jgi:hypothetical protein